MNVEKLNEIIIIIPSLDPDYKLLDVVEGLTNLGFGKILLIDDGSIPSNKQYFAIAQEKFGCELLTHEENKGKGTALKSAFSFVLTNHKDAKAVITVDGDNQHKPQDVLNIAQHILDDDHIVLGVRTFRGRKDIPLRSRFGNYVSAAVFSITSGSRVSDTQTGLRGIPVTHLSNLMKIEGARFEYEMNVLLNLKKQKIKVREIPIETIYIGENESSHFRPITDSAKIIKTIGKFFCSGMLSFGIDILTFSLLTSFVFQDHDLVSRIFYSTLIARVVSSMFNFFMNYKVVFASGACVKKSMMKYYGLVIFQLICSWLGTSLLTSLFPFPIVMKVITDALLFILSFCIQKKYIFKGES